MNPLDAIEIGRDLMPRRWKRLFIAPAILVATWLFPDQTQQAVVWLGQQFSERYMERMANSGLLDGAFSQDEHSIPLDPVAPQPTLEVETTDL
ncbi:hypothetical protein [Dietzia sp. Alg238-R159]|uniref:hypothetical protein n=1 Tax=Dietzia sp. Alg238-R159 TaxID=2305986 RepID=UPI0013D4D74C|nr:hypothetical protein [Dietzia sp. Alg238-R159]